MHLAWVLVAASTVTFGRVTCSLSVIVNGVYYFMVTLWRLTLGEGRCWAELWMRALSRK